MPRLIFIALLLTAIVAASEEQLEISVIAAGDAPRPGIGMGMCGDSIGIPTPAGWPEIWEYSWLEDNAPAGAPLLVEGGGDRIRYWRRPRSKGWGACGSGVRAPTETRRRLLAEMLGVDGTAMPWQAQKNITLSWTGSDGFQHNVRNEVAGEEAKLHATVEALLVKEYLTPTEAQSPPGSDAPALEIQMSLSSDSILLGQPDWVDVRITNRSGDTLRIDTGIPCAGLKPLIVQIPSADPGNGDRVTCRALQGVGYSCSSGLPPSLAPRETLTRRYVLTGNFHITHTGSYAVQLTKLIRYAPVQPSEMHLPYIPLNQSQTAAASLTLTVLPANSLRLLALEQSLAQQVAAPLPTPPLAPSPPGDAVARARAIEAQDNQQVEALDLRNAIAEGLIDFPVAGMEPVFRNWIDKVTYYYYGIQGLKRLNTPEARAVLARIAEATEYQGNSFYHNNSGVWYQSVRRESIDALADMGDRSYLPLLEKLVQDSNQDVHHAAISGLGLLGGEQELPLLTSLAHDGVTPDDRLLAISAIGDTDSLKAVPVLIDLAGSSDADQVRWSYYGLATLTHLYFPKPADGPASALQHLWLSFWEAHQIGARAFSPYECAKPEFALQSAAALGRY